MSTTRGWEAMAACCGLFSPTAKLLKVVTAYLMLAENTPGFEDCAKYSLLKLRRLIVDVFARPRTFPPSTVELDANRVRALAVQPVIPSHVTNPRHTHTATHTHTHTATFTGAETDGGHGAHAGRGHVPGRD